MSLPEKDNVTIIAKYPSVSYPYSAKLFCNICDYNLILLDPQNEEWYCNHCNVSYFPNKGDKVRRGNKFETPRERGRIPPVAMIDDSNATNVRPRELFPKSLEMLKRTGVKIAQFSSSVYGEGI